MLKVAVIGANGFMGRNHARNLRALESLMDVRLVAVADTNPKVAELSAAYGVSVHLDYREMFAKEELDAVVVAVPTALHRAVVCDALDAGLNVLVEKPIAFTAAEAQAMIARARGKGKSLMVGHIEWFNPAVRELMRMIDRGVFGDILMIEAKRLNPFPVGRDTAVGVSIDLATHDIYNILRIGRMIGSPLWGDVLAVGGSSVLTSTKFEDHVSMFLLSNWMVAEATASWLHPFKVRQTTVVGTKGTAVVDLITREIVFYPAGRGYDVRDMAAALYDLAFTERRIPEIPDRTVEPLRLELEEFIAANLEGRESQITAADALQTLAIALEASRQAMANPAGRRR